MPVYGLTGGIGTGKSTASQFLMEFGAVVVEADDVGRQVVAPGSEGLETIVTTFGKALLDQTGALDRQKLGALVFSDPAKRQQLEVIIHPLVQQHSRAQFECLAQDGHTIIVYESALLFESKRHLEMQSTILVTADQNARIARVQQRDGSTKAEIQARMQAQMSEEKKRQLSDYILDNSGDLPNLQRQVQALITQLQ